MPKLGFGLQRLLDSSMRAISLSAGGSSWGTLSRSIQIYLPRSSVTLGSCRYHESLNQSQESSALQGLTPHSALHLQPLQSGVPQLWMSVHFLPLSTKQILPEVSPLEEADHQPSDLPVTLTSFWMFGKHSSLGAVQGKLVFSAIHSHSLFVHVPISSLLWATVCLKRRAHPFHLRVCDSRGVCIQKDSIPLDRLLSLSLFSRLIWVAPPLCHQPLSDMV